MTHHCHRCKAETPNVWCAQCQANQTNQLELVIGTGDSSTIIGAALSDAIYLEDLFDHEVGCIGKLLDRLDEPLP